MLGKVNAQERVYVKEATKELNDKAIESAKAQAVELEKLHEAKEKQKLEQIQKYGNLKQQSTKSDLWGEIKETCKTLTLEKIRSLFSNKIVEVLILDIMKKIDT